MPILVPIDVSAPARTAVDVATTLARARHEDVVLVHAHPGPEPAGLELLAALHELAEPVRDRGVRVRIRVVTGDPVGRLCRWARENRASFIVTGTRGPTDPATSTARGLSLCSSIPVVAVRPSIPNQDAGYGPIHVVSPAHTTAADIAGGLAAQWNRPSVSTPWSGAMGTLPPEVLEDETALTIVSVEGADAWPEWCESLVRDALGSVLIVSRGTGRHQQSVEPATWWAVAR